MYQTSSSEYGRGWQTAKTFRNSFTQSTPYNSLLDTRDVDAMKLPRDKYSVALVHDPQHPCGIMAMSNVPTNTRGEFTNVSKDFYSNEQGLWSNGHFNTPGAHITRGVGTYSNLQGGWGRVGPSTYDSTHAPGDWVPAWQVHAYEPATLRSLRDHRNVDPRDNWVPIENYPQNM